MKWSADFLFLFRLESSANGREHWRATAARKQKEKRAIVYAWIEAGSPKPPTLPVRITLTRLGPRKLDDDNLASAFKTMRDAIAISIGCFRSSYSSKLQRFVVTAGDGGDDEIEWVYRQSKTKGLREYGVRVEMECIDKTAREKVRT